MSSKKEQLPFADFEKDELEELAFNWNEDHNLSEDDPGYIDPNQDKESLVESLQEGSNIADGFIDVDVSKKLVKLPPDQVVRSDNNYRHETDYYDPSMQKGMKDEGGIREPIRVAPTDEETDDGRTIYETESGNRRLFNYKYIQENEDDVELEDEIPALIRETEGTEKQKEADQLLSIWQANESLDQSIIQRLELICDLKNLGMSQQSIAEKLDKSRAYISQLLKLKHLPKKVKDLVHWHYTSDHLKQQGVKYLQEQGVPFEEDDNGDIEILGITYNNAKTLAKLYPKKTDDDFEDRKEEINKFILDRELEFIYKDETTDGGVITAAQLLSNNRLKDALDELKAQYFGDEESSEDSSEESSNEQSNSEPSNTEGGNEPDIDNDEGESTSSEDQNDSEDEGDSSDNSESESSTSSNTDPGSQEATVSEMVDFDPMEMCAKIESGDIELSDGWRNILADELTFEDESTMFAIQVLINKGALIEVE